MTERTIPREDWVSFCEGFSGQHDGWLVRVEVHDAAGGSRTIAIDEPLDAVEAEPGAGRVTVTVGRAGEERRLEIAAVADLRFQETPRGAHQGLRIESADGRTVEVRFRSAARPETLDGFVERR